VIHKIIDFFSKKDTTKDPETGEKWILDHENPFIHVVVEIKDIKKGWVKYYINHTYPSETMQISKFKKMYKPYE
jgi:hypothetical protein